MTNEDKKLIKEAIVDAWMEIRRIKRQQDWESYYGAPSLKDLVSLLRTPKPKVDESQPH